MHMRDEKCIQHLVRKYKGRRPLGITRRRFLNNVLFRGLFKDAFNIKAI
jgi:hypothetical protein